MSFVQRASGFIPEAYCQRETQTGLGDKPEGS
jgi:hypothetical protein